MSTLDTSGTVRVLEDNTGGEKTFALYKWHNLSPLEQGYVTALFANIQWPDPAEGYGPSCTPRFEWLAPESLAQILKDCATRRGLMARDSRQLGRWFLERRQRGEYPELPPVTLYLHHDGQLHLTATSETKGLEQQ